MQLRPSVFEGSTPEEVLFKACDVHGPEVRLSKPERVRVGGMMGFFAKSLYRVRVQAPRVEPITEPLQDLLDETPAVSVDLRTPVGAPRPKTFDEALAHVTGSLGPASGSAGTVADPEWQALVKRLKEESLGETIAVAPSVPDEAPVVVEPEPFVPQRPPAPAPRPIAVEPPSTISAELLTAGLSTEFLAEALGRFGAASTLEEILASLPPSRPLPLTPGSLIAVVGTRDRVLARAKSIAAEVGVRPQDVARAEWTRSQRKARADEDTADVSATAPVRRAKTAPRTTAGRGKAASAKVPTTRAKATAARATTRRGNAASAKASTTRAKAAPARATTGQRKAVNARSAPISSREASSVGLVVHNATEAADLSPGWRRDRVAVVAVFLDDATGRIDLPGARALLRALRPSMTLAIVDATTKSEDVAHLAENVGGIDALMVEKTRSTITPLAILGSQIPVARLDNRPATPRNWAALVRAAVGHDSPRRRT